MASIARGGMATSLIKPSKISKMLPTNKSLNDLGLNREINALYQEQHADITSFICALVEHPSLLGHEESAQNFMEETFSDMGLDIDRFAINHEALKKIDGYSPSVGEWDGHDNIVGIHRAKSNKGKSLILNGHIDVVPIGAEDLWSSQPFDSVVRDGRVFGRGSGDMKAGIAAYVFAFSSLKKLGYRPASDIFLQSVVEEECTGNGALACLHRGYKADAAIIPEPFNETIMSAQMGVMWLQIEITGKPAHVLHDTLGNNAIEATFKIWQHLKKLASAWNQDKHLHPPFGETDAPVKFNLGKISGGEWASSVPTRCQMDVRCGFFPGQAPKKIRQAIEDHLENMIKSDRTLENIKHTITYSGFQSPGCVIDTNGEFISLLGSMHERELGRPAALFASAATTDVRTFQLYGHIPATCYGPEALNIHGVDESVSIQSTVDVSRVICHFITQWCGIEKDD